MEYIKYIIVATTDNAPKASKQNPSPRINVINAWSLSFSFVSVERVQNPTMKQIPTNAKSVNIIIPNSLIYFKLWRKFTQTK